MNIPGRGLLPAAALLIAAASHADPLYVADKLVLNVYAEANQSGERIATLETGDSVEGIEKVENFWHVRLSDGREGWIGANYLSSDAPAIVRLKALQAEQRGDTQAIQKPLNDEIAKLQKQNTALQTELTALKQQAAQPAPTTAAPPPASEPAVDEPEQPDQSTEQSAQQNGASNAWWLWPLLVLAGIAVGFPLGYQALARHIRSKYGGVKVY